MPMGMANYIIKYDHIGQCYYAHVHACNDIGWEPVSSYQYSVLR